MEKIPSGVKVIAVLYYISAALLFIFGILAMALPGIVPLPAPFAVAQGVIIILGLFMLLLAVLSFFIARGLWKGRQWAYFLAILLAVLGLINNIAGFFLNGYNHAALIMLVVNAAIASYLMFDKNAKAAFLKKK